MGLRPAPLTQRADRVTRDLVHAEHWLALCETAVQVEPSESDWRRFGVEPRPMVAGMRSSLTVLGWLLRERLDPPVELSRRAAHGSVPPGEQLYVTGPLPKSPVWQDAQRHRREQQRA